MMAWEVNQQSFISIVLHTIAKLLKSQTEYYDIIHTRVFCGVIGRHLHFTFRWTIFLTLMDIMLFKWVRNVIHTETSLIFFICNINTITVVHAITAFINTRSSSKHLTHNSRKHSVSTVYLHKFTFRANLYKHTVINWTRVADVHGEKNRKPCVTWSDTFQSCVSTNHQFLYGFQEPPGRILTLDR